MVRFLIPVIAVLISTTPCSAAEQDLNRARQLIKEAQDGCEQDGKFLLKLATVQAKAGDIPAAGQSFSRAWRAVEKRDDETQRRVMLIEIARQQTEAGLSAEAVKSARQQSPSNVELLLNTIAVTLAESGQTKAALKVVKLNPDLNSSQRNFTLSLLAMQFSEHRKFVDAYQTLNLIPVNEQLVTAILARKVPAEQLTPAEQAEISRAQLKATGLIVITQDQANAGDWDAALQTAQKILLPLQREIALRHIVNTAAESDQLMLAQSVLNRIQGDEQKQLATVPVVCCLAEQKQFMEARQLSQQIEDKSIRAEALYGIAVAYAAGGNRRKAHSLFADGVALVPADLEAKHAAARQIVSAFLQASILPAAEDFTTEIQDPETRAAALQEIAVAGAQLEKNDVQRLFNRSREVAGTIRDPYQRSVRLREIAKAEFLTGQVKQARMTIREAIQAAQQMELGGGSDVIAITEAARVQTTIGDLKGAADSFRLARDTARRYPERSYVVELLQGVVFAQAQSGDIEAAIESVRREESVCDRCLMLLEIADALLTPSRPDP
ncbi:hypothetical protein [Gimesia sp.]|uniref:hypothetical protein n=1 Tax=Gimesia sp. TaxID=2024833 RepID=UPI003A94B309